MAENAFLWSTTASSNGSADPAVPFPENMLPGAVNDSARALMAGVARLIADWNGTATIGGSANAYTITSSSGHTTYTNGTLISGKVNGGIGNTGPSTLNMNSFGAKAIRIYFGSADADINAGQMVPGGVYQFKYDTAANSAAGGFILLNPSTIVKTGTIETWSTDTAPTGYLFCNGQAVSRTTYAALFAVISTTYGTGDGSTTFNVPDLRGRAPFGHDNMGGIGEALRITIGGGNFSAVLGNTGGLENHTLTLAETPSHSHAGTTGTESATHTHSGTTATESADHTHSGTTGTESATHTHSYNATGVTTASTGLGTSVASPASGSTTGTESATHTHTVTTGGVSATHTHTVTTGTESATHTHSFTTDTKGSGSAHTIMPPAIILNYIIKY